jgi:formamidopyrimidine-DNA glycosylase
MQSAHPYLPYCNSFAAMQSFCAGVGNWVADEVLWHSRLHPEQLLSALQPHHVEALYAALRDVVQTAVAANADASKFPPDWMFHIRCGAARR